MTIYHFFRKTPLSLSEALDALENLPDDVPAPLDIYLHPPDFHSDTDEDSGDEEDNDPNFFSKNQLLAEVELNFDEKGDNMIKAPSMSHQRIQQSWENGDEDDLKLGFFYYNNRKWVGTKTYPLSLSGQSDPIDFFKIFVTQPFVDSVVNYTINYAGKKKNKIINIDTDDFYCFYGVMIISGYTPIPRRRHYWSIDDDIRNEFIVKWMRRTTFEEIFVNIHFCDNDSIDKSSRDRLAKIRMFINHLNELFLKFAPITMNISVDEAMVPYYGRHPCKQYIRNKPVRFGYKAWIAASPAGYCYAFDIYQGQNQERDKTMGLGESVVLDFAKKIKDRFPDIFLSYFFDNFFTGANLICALRNMKCGGTGTVRENRLKNIKMTDKKKMNKKLRGYYESFIDEQNEVILTRWKDSKIVSMLSNTFGTNPLATAQRYNHSEQKKTGIPKPHVIANYNKFMGGVDLLDRHISNYRMGIRGKKFYMPLVLWMLDLAVTNLQLPTRPIRVSARAS